MLQMFSEIRKRNRILYRFGWVCMLGVFICMVLAQSDNTMVTMINAWIKPLKFFASIGIFSWTMAWYLFYLEFQRKVRIYSKMVVIVMLFELMVITWQAANGRISHYNQSTTLYSVLFALMGVAITTLTVWTGYMAYLFFRQKEFNISKTYLWGIRIGIIVFVIFAFEGGIMAQRLSHTVGGPDGTPGLPLFNWSRSLGDLRVAHLFGIHALQIIPLVAYYATSRLWQVFLFSFLYTGFIVVTLIQAFYKIPFIE